MARWYRAKECTPTHESDCYLGAYMVAGTSPLALFTLAGFPIVSILQQSYPNA